MENTRFFYQKQTTHKPWVQYYRVNRIDRLSDDDRQTVINLLRSGYSCDFIANALLNIGAVKNLTAKSLRVYISHFKAAYAIDPIY